MKRRWIWVGLAMLLLVLGEAAWVWREWRRESRFDPVIRAAASRYGVDPMLVRAVIWRESRFHPGALGTRGEIGLMQVQENAAREWADRERVSSFQHQLCLDPGTNTLAGTFYLGKLLKRYAHADDPVPYALADYNAGRANVLKWNSAAASTNSFVFIEQIRFGSTKKYVKSIQRRYRFYKLLQGWGWR